MIASVFNTSAIGIGRNVRRLLLIFVFNSGDVHLELYLGHVLSGLAAENTGLRFFSAGYDRIVQTLLGAHQGRRGLALEVARRWKLIFIGL